MTMEEFDLLAGLSAIVAVVAAVWNYAQFVFDWFIRLFVIEYRTDWDLGNIVLVYLSQKHKPRNNTIKYHDSLMVFVRPLEKVQRVVMEYYNQSKVLFWLGWKPLWFQNMMSDEDSGVPEGQSMVFRAIRRTINWEKLLVEAVDWENSTRENKDDERESRFCVIKCFGSDDSEEEGGMARTTSPGGITNKIGKSQACKPLRWEIEDLGPPHEMSSLEMLSLSPALQDIVSEIKFWYDSEEWYKSHGVPWRRGYAFVGEPGTGKTSLSRGVAEELDIPLFTFDLGSMSNPQFSAAWDRVTRNSAPAIILLEDIDAIFNGRNNVSKTSRLTFDCVLNCMDGAERPDGLLVILTTNNVSKLDPALVRPGRVDRTVQFEPLDRAGRIKLAIRIVEDEAVATRLADEAVSDSAAEFQERCFRHALQARYEERLQQATS